RLPAGTARDDAQSDRLAQPALVADLPGHAPARRAFLVHSFAGGDGSDAGNDQSRRREVAVDEPASCGDWIHWIGSAVLYCSFESALHARTASGFGGFAGAAAFDRRECVWPSGPL